MQKSAFNGKSGYEMNMQTGKKDMSAEELEMKKKTAGVFPELLYKKAGVNYTILGIEQLDTKQAYVLEVKEGSKLTLSYFEVGTFKNIKTVESEGENQEEFTYSEFEIFDGVEFPKALSISTSGLTLEGKVKCFEVNSEINSSIFE